MIHWLNDDLNGWPGELARKAEKDALKWIRENRTMTWKHLPDCKEKYLLYLKSDEWAGKKKMLLHRSRGFCERCGYFAAEEVHHKTYDRLYDELMEDLEHLCGGCHKFEHKLSDIDPIAIRKRLVRERLLSEGDKQVFAAQIAKVNHA